MSELSPKAEARGVKRATTRQTELETLEQEKPSAPAAVSGAPAGAQRSGSGGERRSRGMSELSPKAEARGVKRATTRQTELETLE